MKVSVLIACLSVHVIVGSRVIIVENAPTCYRRVLAGKRALRSHVRRVAPCERLEDCRRECATERRFHCESFNYKLDPSFRGKGLCELMTKPIEAFDIHRDFVEDKDFDFFELDRNSLEPYCPESLRGPGHLHSGYLSSKPDNLISGDQKWDRYDRPRGGYSDADRRYDDRGPGYRGGNRRRPEDQFFVPYQIGMARSSEDESWGQYGGSYGGNYKDRNDHRSSLDHWQLTPPKYERPDPPYGVRPHASYEPNGFDYTNLGSRRPTESTHHYNYGSEHWKRGHWNSTERAHGLSYGESNYYRPTKPSYPVDRSDVPVVKDCTSRRRPGMSLSSGAIRRSLQARNVVECEAACFNEREFKCVSYSYRYSHAHGTDNCFLSERPYRGLDMASDSGSDVYAMPQDHGCSVTQKPWVESECFWHVRSESAVSGSVIKSALTVAGLGACEAECIRAHGFFCRGFSFRFDSPTIGDELENCLLTSSPPTSLEPNSGLRKTQGHELYARGNYGRGCEPALYDELHHKEKQCYLQYDNAAKLIGVSIKGHAHAKDEEACGQSCTNAPFRCLSYSYNQVAPPGQDNCLLSEIRLFDLQRGVDYEHSDDDWLFAFDLFNGECWRKVHGKSGFDDPTQELPQPLSPPTTDVSSPSGPSGTGYIPSGPESGLPSGPPTGYIPEARPSYLPESGPGRPTGPSYLPETRPPSYRPDYPTGLSYKPDYLPGPPDRFKPGYQAPEPYKFGYRPDPPYVPAQPTGPGFKPYLPEEPSGPGYKPGYISPPGYKPGFPPPIPSGPGYRPDPEPAYGPPEPSGPSYRPGYRPTGPPGPSYAPGGPSGPSYGPVGPPSGPPGYGPDRGDEESMTVSWRHYTVSGFPCRQGTTCARNQVGGHWACEPEGGEIGSWDYCCAPTHRCGYSEGFHKPWCYVGPSVEQWRPCSEKYYPYHQHNVPHPSSQGHREGRPRPSGPPGYGPPSLPPSGYSRPGPSPYLPDAERKPVHIPGPYLPEADRRYWDNLYMNGPQAYYDKHGNPLPGYTRVPTAIRPHIKYQHNYGPRPGGAGWEPIAGLDSGEGLDPPVPGGLGAPRYWPVAYLHRGPPPNITYFRFNETDQSATTTEKYDNRSPISPPREKPPQNFNRKEKEKDKNGDKVEGRNREENNRSLSEKEFKINVSDVKTTTTTPKIEIKEEKKLDENDTNKTVKVNTLNQDVKVTTMKAEKVKVEAKDDDDLKGIDDKLDDFSGSIEVLDIEDAKSGDKIPDIKTLEAEERQIEAIGRLLASKRGGKLILEKRSQKDLEAKSIAIDKDFPEDFNFGNRFPTTERKGIIQKVTKDEIERERNIDKSLEVSETATFVRPPRVLSTTENVRKALVNGKIFYDATIREQRDLFSNSSRKHTKTFRPLEDIKAPSVLANQTYGKKKTIRPRNVNPVRRVRRIYRKRYNPDEVRRRLLERERSLKQDIEANVKKT